MKGKWSGGIGVYGWKGLDWVGSRVYGLKVFRVGRVLVGSDDSVGVLAGCLGLHVRCWLLAGVG